MGLLHTLSTLAKSVPLMSIATTSSAETLQ
eukprot:COSAG02_NODE_64860_length_259_cov_0.943750_1_plen_29_part_10